MFRPTILAIAVAVLSLVSSVSAQSNDKWLADYAAMKKFMTEAYANLEWARTKIDLPALDKRTTEALRSAKTDEDSAKVLAAFLREFRDGHLRLREPARPAPQKDETPLAIAPDAEASKVCGELGFRLRLARFSVPFDKLPDFRMLSAAADPFPSGILALGPGRSVAVLAIGLFSADGYFGNCVDAWREFAPKLAKACDGACAERFKSEAEVRLTRTLIAQLRKLGELKPDAIIIDIGGNGGGSNWAEIVAAIVSPKPLRPVQSGFIRHPHWSAILGDRLKTVEKDLARRDLTANQRRYLTAARDRLRVYVAEANAPCDLSFVWTGGEPPKNCTRINATPVFSDGLVGNVPEREVANLESKDLLTNVPPYEFEKSIVKTGLFVLVDRRTASASELFASLIQGARSGTVIGEKTLGAGCGYVDGGTKYFLPNTKLRLMMPDCVRYRFDGVNEVEGIVPDASIWSDGDDPDAKLTKLLGYLARK